MITIYLKDGLPNLEALMADYGTALNRGVVLDSDSNITCRSGLLSPAEDQQSRNYKPFVDKYYVLMPMAQGLTVSDSLREGLTVTKLLTTSDAAFSKVNISETGKTSTEFEEGDIKGPFALGAAVEEGDTRIVWFTTGLMLDDNYNALVGGATETSSSTPSTGCASVKTASPSAQRNEYRSDHGADGRHLEDWVPGCRLIPLGTLAAGITVVVRRRRR
jgi:ABC-2 type transport system permease protein